MGIQYCERVASHASVTPTVAAEPFRASSVKGPCLLRYKVMSILIGVLSRIKLIYFGEMERQPGLLITL